MRNLRKTAMLGGVAVALLAGPAAAQSLSPSTTPYPTPNEAVDPRFGPDSPTGADIAPGERRGRLFGGLTGPAEVQMPIQGGVEIKTLPLASAFEFKNNPDEGVTKADDAQATVARLGLAPELEARGISLSDVVDVAIAPNGAVTTIYIVG